MVIANRLSSLDNVDWFVNEVIHLENKMVFYFKNTKKDIIMTQEDKEDFVNNNICQFCEREILSDKVRVHCLLTGKYHGPAHNTCNINVKQKEKIVILYYLGLIILVITIVICFLKG